MNKVENNTEQPSNPVVGEKRELDAPQEAPVSKKPKAGASKAVQGILNKILTAIREEKKAGGSSRIYLKKYMAQKHEMTNEKQLKKALEAGVESGVLIQNKASFEIKGEVYEVPPEERVEITQIKAGHGEPTKKGHVVVIDYKGYLAGAEEKPFETGSDFQFVLKGGDVIKGMDAGCTDMRVGERRRVEIPYQMGYGKRGSPPEIPGSTDLVFDIVLKMHQPAA